VYPGAVPLRPLCAAFAAALLLCGCGGGDDAGKIETKADFIAAADKICRERDASAVKLSRVQSDADLGRLSGQLAKIYEKAISELESVSLPPGSARPGAEKYVRATVALRKSVQRMSAASSQLQSAAAEKRAGALKDAATQLQTSVNTVQALGEVADQAARTYGMHNCGQTGTAAPVS
jgi:hypothetical protein